MCSAIISTFAIIVAAACYFFGAIAIGAIVLVVCLTVSISKYNNAMKLQPTPMICPNCQSTNVKISKEVSGLSNTGAGTIFAGWGVHAGNVNINRQRLGVCQDCGFDFPYFTRQEISDIQAKAKSSVIIWIIVTIFACVVGGFIFYYSRQ